MGNDSIVVSWTPPPPEWLVYNNCTAATPWLAAYSSMYENGDVSWTGVSMEIATTYLRSMIPSNWSSPTDSDLLVWYQERNNGLEHGGATFKAMVELPLHRCGDKICPYLQWQGDPDLAGVGAMISYAILAFFTSLYFVVLLIDTIRQRDGRPLKRRSTFTFFTSGFLKSLSTFQDAVLLFAVSINIAAITRWLAPIVHPNTSHAYYGLLNSVFMSSFTVFPALTLQSLTPGLHRRSGVRLALWTLTIAVVITVEVFYRYIYMGSYFLTFWNKKVQFNEDIWLERCDSESLRMLLGWTTMAGHIYLTVNCVWWLYHATAGFRRGKHVQKLKEKLLSPSTRAPWRERWDQWQVYFRLANGAFSLAFMWVFLGFFWAYREDVRMRAGSADQDSQWTFGQVLSLATWAPVGLELLSVYIYETKDDGGSEHSDPPVLCRPGRKSPYGSFSSSHSELCNQKAFEETLESIMLDEPAQIRDRPWSPIPHTYAAVRANNFV